MADISSMANNIYYNGNPRLDEVARLLQLQYNRAINEGWDFDKYYNNLVKQGATTRGYQYWIPQENVQQLMQDVYNARQRGQIKDSWDGGRKGYIPTSKDLADGGLYRMGEVMPDIYTQLEYPLMRNNGYVIPRRIVE